MTPETSDRAWPTNETGPRDWFVVAVVVLSLVVVPAVVLAEHSFDLLSALGLGDSALGFIVMIPGIALGGISLVVMLGSPY